MERIVVGIDGSPGAARALEWAAREARLRHATLEVVHAWHTPYFTGFPYTPVVFAAEAFEEVAEATLGTAVESIDERDLTGPLESVLVNGGAAEAILEAAKGADMVVVGSRGRGGFTGLLLGSVSQQVVHHAPCPVVVVPEAD